MTGGREAFWAARDLLLGALDGTIEPEPFPWPDLDEFNWALDHVDALDRDALALWIVDEGGGEQRATFGEISDRSNRVAHLLRAQGVGRGDRVLVMLGNVMPLWETMLAVMKLGAVVVPTSVLLPAGDVADRVRRGRVAAMVAASDLVGRFAAVDASVTRVVVGSAVPGWVSYAEADHREVDFTPDGPTRATDPLLLYFTSGTTSQPKLVQHSHRSYPVGHLSTMAWIGLRPGDIHLNLSSPGWAKHAWSCVFAPWNAGAAVFVVNQERFHAPGLLDAMARARVSTFCAPPTVWRMLIQEDLGRWDLALREAVSAGEPLNPEVIDQVRAAWGLVIRDGYGQTETTAIVGNRPGQVIRPGSMGRPLPGYRVVLLDEAGEPTDEGEICLDLAADPIGLMQGYADDPDRTAEAMRDGYYRTSDVARRDADGFITYVGRTDDVFKASDYRISPFELESVLLEHDAVAEAAVVPSPDPLRLAVPKAFVTLAEGHHPTEETARSILDFARGALAPYKRVRRLEFAELPKTISGKIRRSELRSLEEARGVEVASLRPGEFWEDVLPAAGAGPAVDVVSGDDAPGHLPASAGPEALRRAVAAGPGLAVLVDSADPGAPEVIGRGGATFALVDMEIPPRDEGLLLGQVRAAQAIGLPALVRVTGSWAEDVPRALALGAAGVVLTLVESADEVRDAAAVATVPLQGRGAALWPGTERPYVGVVIETPGAVDAVADIARLPEVDMVLVGRRDLAVAYGVDQADPLIADLEQRVLAVAQAAGTPAGIAVGDPASAATRASEGYALVVMSLAALSTQAVAHAVAEVRRGV